MELVIKVGTVDDSQTSYKDGDIVDALSLDRILLSNANNICHVRNFDIDTVSGLRPNDSLLMKFLEKKNTYKFERLNGRDVKRTNLLTLEEEILSSTPNEKGEYINAHAYISRRLTNQNHKVFGSNGNEIWYGSPRASIDLESIWNDIETHTDNLKQNNSTWQFSEIEKKKFLILNCCKHVCEEEDHHEEHDHSCLDCTCSCELHELDSDFARARCQCVYSGTERLPDIIENFSTEDRPIKKILVAQRRYTVPYWDYSEALSLDIDNIRNPEVSVDARKHVDSRPAGDSLTIDKIEAGIITL